MNKRGRRDKGPKKGRRKREEKLGGGMSGPGGIWKGEIEVGYDYNTLYACVQLLKNKVIYIFLNKVSGFNKEHNIRGGLTEVSTCMNNAAPKIHGNLSSGIGTLHSESPELQKIMQATLFVVVAVC